MKRLLVAIDRFRRQRCRGRGGSGPGIEADGEIIEGNPPDEIVSLADSRDSDLIVVGSREQGTPAGALLGSVSRAVVQHAHRPVLDVAKQAPARQRQVA